MPQVDSRMGAAVDVWDEVLIQHRVRIIHMGILATFVVLASFLIFLFLPGGDTIPLHIFVPLWLLAAGAGIAALLAPWQRIFSSWIGRGVLYVWSVVDILLITALIGWVPQEDATFFFCYVLTTIFFSLLYPRRSQILLFAFTVVCYSVLYLSGHTTATPAEFFLRIGLLAAILLLASFSSRELMRGVLEAKRHQIEAEQQKALHESLAQAQSDLGEGVSIIQLSTKKITYANDAFCRIYGYSKDEILSMSYMDLLVPEHQVVAEGLKRTRESGAATADYDRDFRGVRKDGSQVVVDVVSKSLSDDLVVSVIRDVTELRKAEEDLRGREELFRAVSELTSDFIYSMRIGPNGLQTWEWVTDGFRSVTGYDVDDPAVNAGWAALMHPDDLAGATEKYRHLLSTRGSVRHELSIATKSGEQRWIDMSAEAVIDPAKNRVTRIFGAVQDITERRSAQQAESQKAELLQAISELTSDYVYAARFYLDGRTEWLWVTDGLTRVTGYLPQEVEHDGWGKLIHPDDLERATQALQDLFVPGSSSISLDHRIVTKDGHTRYVRTQARAGESRAGQDFVQVHGAVQDVTDRHLAEKALRASERRYRTLFDRLPLGLFVRHFDGTGLDANPACVEMFGYPDRHTFVTTHAHELYVDATDRAGLVDAVKDQEEAVLETEMRRYDGSTFWGLMHVHAVRNEDGDPVYLEGAIADVTDKRQAEQQLRHSVSLLRSTIESTWDGILVVGLDGRIETHNSRFADMWELSGELLEAADDEEALASVLDRVKDPDRFLKRVRELYAEPERESFDLIEMKDGRLFERFSRPQRQGDEILGRVWSFRDVTERKRNASQLEESLALLRATLESVAEGILVIGDTGGIVAYNQRFVEMWGLSETDLEDADGVSVAELSASKVKDKESFLTSVERIRREGLAENVELIELADGRLLERFTRAASDSRVGRVISFRDITQRRALEEQLRQAQKMEAVGRLAGGVAHDFNNLLTAILGYCELLRSASGISEDVRNDIGEIDSAAQIGADITAQLLDLSRRRVLRPEVLDVNEVVTNMEPMLRRLIGGQVVLDVRVAQEACRAEVDRSQIEQVLLNLVVNARDAMSEGGGVIISTDVVELSREDASKGLRLAPGPHVVLTVADDGAGIDPAVKDRIFEPFFTTRHGEGSTGLGLSTVYGIVSQYNGHIAVDSETGVGTTFRVYIPSAPEAAVPIARRRAAQRWLAGTETILLVEDDDAIRRLTKRSLERCGYLVLEASGGAEALEMSARTPTEIQLLVTDVVMPGMGGRDLGARLSKIRPDIKILYMSGYTGEALARFGDLGWNEDFLAKPFRPEALANKVREILNRENPHRATR